MKNSLTRREFIGSTAVMGAALSTMGLDMKSNAFAAQTKEKNFKTQLYSGFICGNLDAAAIENVAQFGGQGIETTAWNVDVKAAREARNIAESNGIRIHSVMRAWTNLNQADQLKTDIESIKTALKSAAAYGADAILLVPCRIDNAGPKPWDFDIEFDPQTCKVSKVVSGDNAPYADYIKLQNEATEITYSVLEELIPVAAYEGVTIGIENVWNNLWVKPEFAAAFVQMFDNRWIKFYYDMGNHVKYAKTEDWLRILGGKNIVKLHFKDFLVDQEKPAGGDFVPIGKGSIDWLSVRDTIEEIGYSGWVTFEDVNYFSKEQHVQLFSEFAAGKKFSVE